MIRSGFALLLLLCATSPAFAQDFTLQTVPGTARIYRQDVTGGRTLIGAGTARFKVEKDKPNTIFVEAEGFAPVTETYVRGQKYPKIVEVHLKDRLVKLSAMPYDAQILANGQAVGRQTVDIVVPEGKSVTVELKKSGYFTRSKTYHNQPGADLPPVTDRLELTDRLVLVTAAPAGASILVDDNQVGETSADVVVPVGKCVTARIVRAGFAPIEKTYCNRDQAPAPPLNDAFTLRDRQTTVNTTPASATLVLSGRNVGSGNFNVVVQDGMCIDIAAVLDGYVAQKKTYCNQPNMPVPPTDDHLQLVLDEAYESSIESDQANVNFTIEVGPGKTPDQAWKLVSQIVLSAFDVLEITDKDTGYMRTAWAVKTFPHSTVRTRVIVKLGDTDPLKYVVKISSEYAWGVQSVKDDDVFKEWDRLLKGYKDIINEMQARLR